MLFMGDGASPFPEWDAGCQHLQPEIEGAPSEVISTKRPDNIAFFMAQRSNLIDILQTLF